MYMLHICCVCILYLFRNTWMYFTKKCDLFCDWTYFTFSINKKIQCIYHCAATDLTPAAWRTAADSPPDVDWGRWPLAPSPVAPLPSSAPAASPALSAAGQRPPGSNADIKHLFAFGQCCAPCDCPHWDLFVQRLSGGVQLLLQRQQSRVMLLFHDGEVSVVLLSRSGQRVRATEIHQLLLHAVHCCLGNPLFLDVLKKGKPNAKDSVTLTLKW